MGMPGHVAEIEDHISWDGPKHPLKAVSYKCKTGSRNNEEPSYRILENDT